MTHDDKLKRAMEELAGSPIRASSYDPGFYKLLRHLGFKARPPHYAGFFANVIISGLPFALIWGGVMWFLVWEDANLPISVAIWAGAVTGILFGSATAMYYNWSSKRHNLSRWQDL